VPSATGAARFGASPRDLGCGTAAAPSAPRPPSGPCWSVPRSAPLPPSGCRRRTGRGGRRTASPALAPLDAPSTGASRAALPVGLVPGEAEAAGGEALRAASSRSAAARVPGPSGRAPSPGADGPRERQALETNRRRTGRARPGGATPPRRRSKAPAGRGDGAPPSDAGDAGRPWNRARVRERADGPRGGCIGREEREERDRMLMPTDSRQSIANYVILVNSCG
jgi:hypothetical protein